MSIKKRDATRPASRPDPLEAVRNYEKTPQAKEIKAAIEAMRRVSSAKPSMALPTGRGYHRFSE